MAGIVESYIKKRELVFIKEGKFYCSSQSKDTKKCPLQCEKCKKTIRGKLLL